MAVKLVNGTTEITLGTDTSIIDSFSKQVTKIPIVSKPAEDNIAIESGSSRSVSVSFTRMDPIGNADWVEGLFGLINRWQTKTDGLDMHITENTPGT